MSAIDRESVKEACRVAAFSEGAPCPHCKGSGRIEGGRKIIHSFRSGIGADWDLEGVLAAVDEAAEVRWQRGFAGHDLVVIEPSGGCLVFQVKAPQGAIP